MDSIILAISSGIKSVIAYIESFYNFVVKFPGWVIDLIKQLMKDGWEFFTDGFVWVFDKSMGTAVSVANSVDVSGVAGQVGAWGRVPVGVADVFSALGLGDCLAVIASALTIRIVLQLIPFVRLGS